MAPYNWPVVDNGLDFLAQAVEDLATDDPSRHKYVAMHLFASIEVLVKARLGREHWSLVMSKVDSASIQDYQSGNFQSVGAALGLERLKKIAGVEISQSHLASVKAVERLRNRVAHFALAGEPSQAVAVQLGRGLDFLLWFLAAQLRPGAPVNEASAIDELLDSIREQLGAITELVQERMKSIGEDLAAAGAVLFCPRCNQSAMVLVDGNAAECLFCLWVPEGDVSASEYVDQILGISRYRLLKEGGTWPIHFCPQCGNESLVEGIEAVGGVDIRGGCFSCGFVGGSTDFGHCSRCGALTVADGDDFELCDDCASYIMDGD